MEKQLWFKQPARAAELQHELQTAKIHVSSLGKKYDAVINDFCPGYVADARTAKAAEGDCRKWMADYGVESGKSWGTLPLNLRGEWKAKGCDSVSAAPAAPTAPTAASMEGMSPKCKEILSR
jgi:hypothetical protein